LRIIQWESDRESADVCLYASCATIPASCLGTQNKASIKVTATSVADPNQPPASTTFVITSNISFGILLMADAGTMKNICNPYIYSATDPNILAELASDPCGFKGWPANNSLNPPGPNLAVGYGAALAQANIQGFGSVTGLTWTPTASFAPASGIQSAFTAPQTVPTGGNVAITAYAIADFTSKATLAMPIVGSKLIPDSIVAPFTLTVPSGKSTGSLALDLLGPASGTINFTCPAAGFVNLTQTTCAFSPNPANATGTTVVTMTLNVTRSSVMPTRPPLTPLPPMPGLPIAVLSILSLLLLVLSYATREWTRLHWAPAYRWSNAFALLILCALVLTWAGACGQFSQPSTVPPPPIPPTQPASGAATAAATPSLDASPATNSLIVPSTVVQ
jgi:hypothetical protein